MSQGCHPLAEHSLDWAVTLGKVDTIHLSSHIFHIVPEKRPPVGVLHAPSGQWASGLGHLSLFLPRLAEGDGHCDLEDFPVDPISAAGDASL